MPRTDDQGAGSDASLLDRQLRVALLEPHTEQACFKADVSAAVWYPADV
jgi:hypothetical protein